VVNVIYSLITIPTDGIVLIVIFFGTIQTGVEFHCDFLPSGCHCILTGSRQIICFYGRSLKILASDKTSDSALLPSIANDPFRWLTSEAVF
jgi:hypothetical protein